MYAPSDFRQLHSADQAARELERAGIKTTAHALKTRADGVCPGSPFPLRPQSPVGPYGAGVAGKLFEKIPEAEGRSFVNRVLCRAFGIFYPPCSLFAIQRVRRTFHGTLRPTRRTSFERAFD